MDIPGHTFIKLNRHILCHFLILFQILMNVQLATHVEMGRAPTLLGALNATAMRALSQGPWWIVKASDTLVSFLLDIERFFNASAFVYIVLMFYWWLYSSQTYFPLPPWAQLQKLLCSPCLIIQHLRPLRIGIYCLFFPLRLGHIFLVPQSVG